MLAKQIDLSHTMVIGDVHSSYTHLSQLLSHAEKEGIDRFVFLGDLVDRGDDVNSVIDVVHSLVQNGKATCLMGNHDWKLVRYYDHGRVSLAEESQKSVDELTAGNAVRFQEIFEDKLVMLYDPRMRIMCSHATGYRPYDFFKMMSRIFKEESGIDIDVYDLVHRSRITMSRKKASPFIYGKTGHAKDDLGRPIRLPISQGESDFLEGWNLLYGHIHAADLYPEKNLHVMCLDFCCGEEGGKLAGLIIRDRFEDNPLKREVIIID